MKDLDEERDEYETRELYHINLGNSDVWGMQCCFLNWFLSMPDGHAQKPFFTSLQNPPN